jgi:hypothetical protein
MEKAENGSLAKAEGAKEERKESDGITSIINLR